MGEQRDANDGMPVMTAIGTLLAAVGGVTTIAAVVVAIAVGEDRPPFPWSDAGLVVAVAGIVTLMLLLLLPSGRKGRRPAVADRPNQESEHEEASSDMRSTKS